MNHPVISHYTSGTIPCQSALEHTYHESNGNAISQELRRVIDNLVDRQFRCDLHRMKHHVATGYLMEPLWNAYLLSFILNTNNTNDLIRRLEENPSLVEVCGFNMDRPLPSRWVFDRFIISLAEHPELVERLLDKAVGQLHERLPEFGVTVAVDSTSVRSHSNPNKKIRSDPEADFMVREGRDIYKVWKWGYKLHLLVDTTWELPIACELSLAKESDVTHLIPLITKARQKFTWFKPWHLVADKGYDAGYNYKAAYDIGAIPIIKMRERLQNPDGRYSLDEAGMPHCQAGLPLLSLGRDWRKGMKYVCPHRANKIECRLIDKCTLKVVWVSNFWEYRKTCSIPRDSQEWAELYSKRNAIEHVNSKLKMHRRLDSHCHRGLSKVRLHCLMSVLSLTATALAEANANCIDRVRACTRKVA